MITYKQGSIFDSEARHLVNPVNCLGISGKGLALEFKKRWPNVFERYKIACQEFSLAPGDILPIKSNALDLYTIIHAATKDNWREPSHYYYVESCLQQLAIYMNHWEVKHIAIPALGCGLGGLDWKIVKPMFEQYLGQLDSNIEVYEPQ